jgi:hypothetical protein
VASPRPLVCVPQCRPHPSAAARRLASLLRPAACTPSGGSRRRIDSYRAGGWRHTARADEPARGATLTGTKQRRSIPMCEQDKIEDEQIVDAMTQRCSIKCTELNYASLLGQRPYNNIKHYSMQQRSQHLLRCYFTYACASVWCCICPVVICAGEPLVSIAGESRAPHPSPHDRRTDDDTRLRHAAQGAAGAREAAWNQGIDQGANDGRRTHDAARARTNCAHTPMHSHAHRISAYEARPVY